MIRRKMTAAICKPTNIVRRNILVATFAVSSNLLSILIEFHFDLFIFSSSLVDTGLSVTFSLEISSFISGVIFFSSFIGSFYSLLIFYFFLNSIKLKQEGFTHRLQFLDSFPFIQPIITQNCTHQVNYSLQNLPHYSLCSH